MTRENKDRLLVKRQAKLDLCDKQHLDKQFSPHP